jgi:integrative and conjugative element protein (TIGR02256 family)
MQKCLTWTNPLANGYILLDQNVLDRIERYRQISPGYPEAGGLLIGYRRGHHLEIVDATVPFPKDRRKRTFFDRRDAGHKRYILRRWAQSGKTMDYLGEWHTHPEALPRPSHLDISEWKSVLRRARTPMAFVILGTSGMWIGCGNANSIKSCGS